MLGKSLLKVLGRVIYDLWRVGEKLVGALDDFGHRDVMLGKVR